MKKYILSIIVPFYNEKENIDILHAMSDALMKYETIDKEQIAALMKGETPQPPKGWDDSSTSSGSDSSNDAETSKEDKSSSDEKIGGPAGEH